MVKYLFKKLNTLIKLRKCLLLLRLYNYCIDAQKHL